MAKQSESLLVNKAIVLGLGEPGLLVLSALEDRLREEFEGGIPVIQLLNVHWRESPHPQIQQYVIRLDSGEQVDQPAGLFPGVTRKVARESLLRHHLALKGLFQRAYDQLASAETARTMEQRGLRIRSENRLDLYVIAALGDPFGGGVVIDLAFWLRKFAEGLGSDAITTCTGLLLLPGFSEEVEGTEGAERERRWAAYAYAALRELDYYMEKNLYECKCEIETRDGRQSIRVDNTLGGFTRMAPFDPPCYLISPINEGGQIVRRLSEISRMVGEWLYQRQVVLPESCQCPQSGGDARNAGKIAAYGSIGLTRLYVPASSVLEWAAHRLAKELVDEHLLARESKRVSVRENPEHFCRQNLLSPENLERRLQGQEGAGASAHWTQKAKEYNAISLVGLASSGFDVTQLEISLNIAYTTSLTENLPEAERCMYEEACQIGEDMSRALEKHIQDLLDAPSPSQGLARAQRFLRQLSNWAMKQKDRLAKEEDSVKQTLEGWVEPRGMYYAAATIFGPPAPWLIILAGLILLAYVGSGAYLLGRLISDPFPPIVFLLFSLLAIVGTGILTWDWVNRKRIQYILAWRERVELLYKTQWLRFLKTLYERWIERIAQEQNRLTNFRNRMTRAQKELKNGLDDPARSEKMFGFPYGSLAESVLTPAFREEFYTQSVSSDRTRELEDLFSQQPFSSWRDFGEAEILESLLEFARHRPFLRAFLDKDVEELLTGQEDRVVQQRIERLLAFAQPYWLCDLTQLDPKPPAPVIYVGIPRGRGDGRIAGLLTRTPQESKRILETAARHQMLMLAMRGQIPLFAIRMVAAQLRECYEALSGTVGREALHTSEEHLALPDLLPLGYEERLDERTRLPVEPRLVLALARMFRILRKRREGDQAEWGYSYQSEDDVLLQRGPSWKGLGKTLSQACAALSEDAEGMQRLWELVSERLQAQTDDLLLARSLDDYLRRRERDLAVWEKSILETYLDALTERYRSRTGVRAGLRAGRASEESLETPTSERRTL